VRIHFYMPENCLPPESGRDERMSGNPRRLAAIRQGSVRSMLECPAPDARLHRCGVPVGLVHRIPEVGIVQLL